MAIGDLIYRGASVWLRLVGNTTTTRKFLRETGNGTSAAAPAWDTLVEADIASALSNTTSAHNALSNVVSNIISAGGGGVSVTSNELSVAGAALSNAISALSASHTSLVNRVSVNSATGGAGSVTSNEVSAVSAQAASALSQAVSVLSQAISVTNATVSNLTAAHNALSNTVSGLTGGTVEQTIFKASNETRTGASATSAAMSADASLVFSVTSAATYAVEGQLLLSSTSAIGDARFGWSVPTSVVAYWGPHMISAINPMWDGQVQTGTPPALLRETNTWGIACRADGAVIGAHFRATFVTGDTPGTVRLTHGVETSTTGVNTLMAGSFLRVLKVS